MHLIPTIPDPNIALLLIVVGLLGIFAEFSSPGAILPGVAGATLTVFGVASLAAGPLDWRGVALIVLALVAFSLEAKLITRGILTVTGAVALLIGLMILVDSSDPARRIHWGTAVAVTIPFALITSFLLSVAVGARRNKFAVPIAILKVQTRESKSQS